MVLAGGCCSREAGARFLLLPPPTLASKVLLCIIYIWWQEGAHGEGVVFKVIVVGDEGVGEVERRRCKVHAF